MGVLPHSDLHFSAMHAIDALHRTFVRGGGLLARCWTTATTSPLFIQVSSAQRSTIAILPTGAFISLRERLSKSAHVTLGSSHCRLPSTFSAWSSSMSPSKRLTVRTSFDIQSAILYKRNLLNEESSFWKTNITVPLSWSDSSTSSHTKTAVKDMGSMTMVDGHIAVCSSRFAPGSASVGRYMFLLLA